MTLKQYSKTGLIPEIWKTFLWALKIGFGVSELLALARLRPFKNVNKLLFRVFQNLKLVYVIQEEIATFIN